MTAQGFPYARKRRALDRGNLVEALSSASELEHVGLVEAIELCLLVAEKEPAKYERLALRRHARYCAEAGHVAGAHAQAVLSLLLLIPGEQGRDCATALASLVVGPSGIRDRLARALHGWSSREPLAQ